MPPEVTQHLLPACRMLLQSCVLDHSGVWYRDDLVQIAIVQYIEYRGFAFQPVHSSVTFANGQLGNWANGPMTLHREARSSHKREKGTPKRGRTDQQTLVKAPMQPARHRYHCSPCTHAVSLHNKHSHYQRPECFSNQHISTRPCAFTAKLAT